MRIALVTPEQDFAGGNTTTSDRWLAILRELGHQVSLSHEWAGGGEVLVALHARKSAASIAAFPGPVVVAATGTDLYVDLPHSPEALASFERADRIVVLNPLAIRALPAEVRERARVILQSASPLARTPPKDPPWTVSVLGHLRAVKDPLAVAEAARLLPAESRIRVVHAGGALEPALGAAAAREMAENQRYSWHGGLPRGDALQLLACSHVLAVPSLLEGGPNVIGESLVNGVPVLASRIDGNVGLLGEDWPALFSAGDRAGLAGLLLRWERDAAFRADLQARTASLAAAFAPSAERDAWRILLDELTGANAPLGGTRG
jgi:putative glycosyltransferase (TIGR04348 family)